MAFRQRGPISSTGGGLNATESQVPTTPTQFGGIATGAPALQVKSPALELAHWSVENTLLLERARTQSLELRAGPQPLNPGPSLSKAAHLKVVTTLLLGRGQPRSKMVLVKGCPSFSQVKLKPKGEASISWKSLTLHPRAGVSLWACSGQGMLDPAEVECLPSYRMLLRLIAPAGGHKLGERLLGSAEPFTCHGMTAQDCTCSHNYMDRQAGPTSWHMHWV